MLPVVVIELPPGKHPVAAVQAMTDACSEAVRGGGCVTADDLEPGQAAGGVAIIHWGDREGSQVQVQVGVRAGTQGAWLSRELRFRSEDELLERWRAVGLTIASLVGQVPSGARESTAAAASEAGVQPNRGLAEPPARAGPGGATAGAEAAADAGSPDARATPEREAAAAGERSAARDSRDASPKPAAAREEPGGRDQAGVTTDRTTTTPPPPGPASIAPWLAAGGMGGPGFVPGPWQGGGWLAGGALLPALALDVEARLAQTLAPRSLRGLAGSWTLLTLDTGPRWLLGPVAVLPVAGVRLARLRVTAKDPLDGAQGSAARWIAGALVGVDVTWPAAETPALLLGVEVSKLTSSTRATARGAELGVASDLLWNLRLGVRFGP